MAVFAPNAKATWLDAWAGAVVIGLGAGLLAVGGSRLRPWLRRLWDFITGVAALGLVIAAAGSLLGRRRIR